MSWLITPQQKIDPDAAVYLSRVEAADGQVLEAGVRTAVESFIVGCKTDGLWNAIKASCILAGARTRLGALTPLAGTAPTSFNFVDGDYNRKTGLVGNGSTKYLNSNWASNSVSDNDRHAAAWVSSYGTVANGLIFQNGLPATAGRTFFARSASSDIILNLQLSSTATVTFSPASVTGITGLAGLSRNNSSNFTLRVQGGSTTISSSSVASQSGNLQIFGFNAGIFDGRLAFYSIGESLNLALLDARVTTLVNAIDAAIP